MNYKIEEAWCLLSWGLVTLLRVNGSQYGYDQVHEAYPVYTSLISI